MRLGAKAQEVCDASARIGREDEETGAKAEEVNDAGIRLGPKANEHGVKTRKVNDCKTSGWQRTMI